MMPSMDYSEALRQSRVLELLDGFDPRPVGTLPLGLAVATSDIDIVCHAADLDAFAEIIWKQYRDFRGFQMHQWRSKGRPIVARFDFGDWVFEFVGDVSPVGQQPAAGRICSIASKRPEDRTRIPRPRSGWTAILTRRC